jgi:hypothetical protein
MIEKPTDASPSTPWRLIAENRFQVGEEDLLEPLRKEFPQEPADPDMRKRCQAKWDEFIKESRIRFGTILKSDTVSVLLGAGASKHAGGVLLGRIPLSVEGVILEEGIRGDRVSRWLKLFYTALQRIAEDKGAVPSSRSAILARSKAVSEEASVPEFHVNLEELLSVLFRWQATLPKGGGRVRLDGEPPVDARSEDLEQVIHHTKTSLVARCVLPSKDVMAPDPLHAHRQLLKKVLTRPLNLKRINLFTLNYDTLIEQAADAEGIIALDGFVGMLRRVFRPESYDQDLYFPAETTEGRVHRLDRVVHLYKLHGSITWRASKPDWDNPYGVVSVNAGGKPDGSVLIYPTPLKHGDALGMPYAELFRRFAGAVVRPQSVLVAIGYGFGDDHIVSIIRQALTVPSFRLIIVDPNPQSSFVDQLHQQEDRRIWIITGPLLGRFNGFVDNLLPDLRDEEIEKKVMATYRALSPKNVGAEADAGEVPHGK